MTTSTNTAAQTAVTLLENTIAELTGALEALGEVEFSCNGALRQQTAIIDRLEAAELELAALEAAYYNNVAEGFGY